MSNEVDYYDVQGMIRDVHSEIRGEISDAVSDLRRDLFAIVDELREDISGLSRMLASRTDHLA